MTTATATPVIPRARLSAGTGAAPAISPVITQLPHGSAQSLPRPRLLSSALLLRFISIIGSSISFYLLLSVVPLAAASTGSGAVAGWATSALMLTSVAGELTTPWVAARFGYRTVLATGLFLLGAPAFGLMVAAGPAVIVAVCLVRGLGFGITVVAGGALTASLIPPERRGEGLALTGVVAGVPAMVALPLGVVLAGSIGYAPVFAIGGAAAVVAVAAIPGLPCTATTRKRPGVAAGLRTGALIRPALIFMTTAMAAGTVVTFLPLAVPKASRNLHRPRPGGAARCVDTRSSSAPVGTETGMALRVSSSPAC